MDNIFRRFSKNFTTFYINCAIAVDFFRIMQYHDR